MFKVLLYPVGMIRRLIWQSVFLALGQVWANKFRAILTALGIIIGVGSVTMVAAALDGMEGFVMSEFERYGGARKMWLWGQVPDDKRDVMSYSDVKMSMYEARLIEQYAPSIDLISVRSSASWDIGYGKTMQKNVNVMGIWPIWHEMEDRHVILGRPFSDIDNDERRQVCLINDQAIEELKLNTDPVGDFVLVGGRRFLIVGVLETVEAGMMGGNQPRTEMFIPFETLKMMNPYTGAVFAIKTVSADVSEDAKSEIRFILRNHRQLDPDDEDTFRMWMLQSAIEDFNKQSRVIRFVVAGVVGISLVVGGVGIMNIMLVSVSERTREIGLRKAVGAKPPVVLLQFLVEAVVLCLFGGAIGLGIGFVMVWSVQFVPNLPIDEFHIPAWALWLSVGFSAGVGIVFGMFPAIKAAMLNPIDALRHE